MHHQPPSTGLPAADHDTLASMVRRYGLGDVLLDLAATAEDEANASEDLRTIERRSEVAKRLLTAAVAAERLRL